MCVCVFRFHFGYKMFWFNSEKFSFQVTQLDAEAHSGAKHFFHSVKVSATSTTIHVYFFSQRLLLVQLICYLVQDKLFAPALRECKCAGHSPTSELPKVQRW